MTTLIRRLLGASHYPTRRGGPRVAIAIRINGQTRILIGKDKA